MRDVSDADFVAESAHVGAKKGARIAAGAWRVFAVVGLGEPDLRGGYSFFAASSKISPRFVRSVPFDCLVNCS
jgi:hypothetical protein